MAITSAIMQMRRGLEADFDPDKMKPGEWAVSLDKKYVRMCFSVGVCVRMATYDAFEVDMAQIEKILEECQTIEDAVKQIQSEIDAKEIVIEKYVQDAKTYSEMASDEADRATLEADRAKAEADRASSIANIGIATTEKTGLVKPDGTTITVDEDGTIHASEGTTDYEDLENKPQIEGVELSGNKTLSELGIASADDLSTANENIDSNSEKISEVEVKIDTIIEKAELNIKNSASGENIHLTDSANGKNVTFGLYGKATQDGEPTPDNPIEIVVSGSDGSVEVVSENEDLTQSTNAIIPTPNGLCGIKVSSGGNYTDENGQQWICDEIVKYADGSGKRVQRLYKKVFNGTETLYLASTASGGYYFIYYDSKVAKGTSNAVLDDAMCNRLQRQTADNLWSFSDLTGYSLAEGSIRFRFTSLGITTEEELKSKLLEWNTEEKPLVVWTKLKEPIITDLTAEEIAEIEKLHTFYPVTNISNDADCGMSIKYLCDSKNYIDNRLAQIEAVLINNI